MEVVDLSPSIARYDLWRAGIVAEWYLRDYQKPLYRFIRQQKNPLIQCSRRFGKTTTIFSFIAEELSRHPGWIARWCFPEKGQAHEIMMSINDKIKPTAPDSHKFEFKSIGSYFVNGFGSRIYIRGVNEDRGESARGAAANIIIADEFGFWREADYIAREVLRPQLDKQPGGWFIRTSTPPRDLAHPFYDELEIAEREGRAITRTIYDRTDLTEKEFDDIVRECRGIESPAFKREYLCQKASDPDMLVIPEYRDDAYPDGNLIDDEVEIPQYATTYVGGDSGADDNTALVFAWYNFDQAQLVIDDEWVANGRTTREIVEIAKSTERRLWGDRKVRRRVYDAAKQIIYDIYTDHTWPVQMPDKADKLAAIHELRNLVMDRRLVIKRRCRHLRRQLAEGLWRDEKHLDFQRNDTLGHLDAIAAAIYLVRSVEWNLNPRPPHAGLSKYTHHIPPDRLRGTTEAELRSAFAKRGRR